MVATRKTYLKAEVEVLRDTDLPAGAIDAAASKDVSVDASKDASVDASKEGSKNKEGGGARGDAAAESEELIKEQEAAKALFVSLVRAP